MFENKATGDAGEKEVIELVPCPNCSNALMLMPPSFPLFDVQCTRCLFRAQVKTSSSMPRGIIRGAGWDIYEKVLKAGHLAPPLIVNYHWSDNSGLHHQIKFYPFIAKENVKKYSLGSTAKRANYRMFNYVNLDKIPSLTLYESSNQ